jgi:hypothetical protein
VRGIKVRKVASLVMVSAILLSTFVVLAPRASAASQVDINTAIDKGLAFLNGKQSSNGEWSLGDYPVACTAVAVLAFENAPSGHYGWNSSDPYHTTVQNGLDWLFSQANVVAINGSNSAGDPDIDGNGIGIGWYGDGQPVYETPIALMAIVSSSAPTNVTTTGPANVTGRTYHDIAQDVVDWIAWAQNSVAADGQYEGGWRYQPQSGHSDNSVSQWPVLGLLAAEEAWGIGAPDWVKDELMKWTTTMQDLGGDYSTNSVYGAFDYQPGRGLYTPGDSAAGILQLTYCGVNDTDPRIIAAKGYLNRDWNPNGYCPNGDDYGWNWNIGDLYSMYAVMKACSLTTPNAIQFIADYTGTPGVEWYNGTGEYADALIANQGPAHGWPDGSWNNWVNVTEGDEVSFELGTAWGVLVLECREVANEGDLEVTVIDAATSNPIVGANVSIQGPETDWNITGTNGNWTFSDIKIGSYTVTASMTAYFSNTTLTIVNQGQTTNCTLSLQVTMIRDLAVTEVVPDNDWVYQGKLCHAGVNVTVANLGATSENFTLTLYAVNATATPASLTIGTQPITNLPPNGTLVLRFVWNSEGAQPCHWYNITAVASTVPGEINITNNVMSSLMLVKVRLVGDVNGDGTVDIRDAIVASNAFGSKPEDPNWNPGADINNDDLVNTLDFIMIAMNFGKACQD